jgi:hypothetical protein
MDFDILSHPAWVAWITITALAVCFPKDAILFVLIFPLWAWTIGLNYFLMFQAWKMHRQIVKDCVKMNLPPPAFKFIPIWDR